jgi:hypothetical protein
MPTYYGTDANGADVWVDSGGNYVDQNGNAINPAFPLTPTNTTGSGSLINAGSTVNPNPAVPNTAQGVSASQVTAMSNTVGQWGATIAAIVAGTPATVTSTGAKVGVPAAGQVALAGVNSTMIVLIVIAVVVLLVIEK